jgi:lysozyme family protein
MSDFKTALARTLAFEGEYTPDDIGHRAFCGINEGAWPNWEGWKLVDAWLAGGKVNDQNWLILQGMVSLFYRENFWTVIHGDEIADQAIANELFDGCVNAGVTQGVKFLQNALGFLDYRYGMNYDGALGPITLGALGKAIKAYGADVVLMVQKSKRVSFYGYLVTTDPKKQAFLKSWLRRLV